NECLNVWHVAGLVRRTSRTARRTARWITVSCKWWRRRWRVTGSKYVRVAGNTHCQGHSRPALGVLPPERVRYLHPSGSGSEVVEPWPGHVKEPTVEEQQRRQRLVLRRCADSALDGQSGQEPRLLHGAHLGGVTLPVKQNVAPYPAKVGVLSPTAVMADP